MFRFDDNLKVYLHRDPVDFRYGMNSLSILVEQSMHLLSRNKVTGHVSCRVADRWMLKHGPYQGRNFLQRSQNRPNTLL
ncbi:IS66 Orf2 family protein [Burkholderia sp. MR1]|nr:IS66 Orf2 family protein [Burkholderia sp. MR1]